MSFLSCLILGLSCAIGIFLYIQHEWSYDRFFANKERIYRLVTTGYFNGTENRYSRSNAVLADYVRQNSEGVERLGRLFARQAALQINNTNAVFREDDFYLADPEILDIFTLTIVEGKADY